MLSLRRLHCVEQLVCIAPTQEAAQSMLAEHGSRLRDRVVQNDIPARIVVNHRPFGSGETRRREVRRAERPACWPSAASMMV